MSLHFYALVLVIFIIICSTQAPLFNESALPKALSK